jgi:ADP-ribose pyrophosphatase YjhB (NUDIX family)
MKNPVPTVDVIIQRDFQALFVKRKKNPFKQYLSLPGGFVDEAQLFTHLYLACS